MHNKVKLPKEHLRHMPKVSKAQIAIIFILRLDFSLQYF